MRVTQREVLHLAGSVAALTLGFAFVEAGGGFDIALRWNNLMSRPIIWIASFIAVFSGFIFHELAHKIVAIRYGYWAEFQSQPRGLIMSILFAFFGGFLVAAPGAVHIHGYPDHRENGIISLVGPGTNLLIALIAFPFTLTTNSDATFPTIMGTVAFVNAVLAAFNMVPLGNFDGRKIWQWNKPIAITMLLASIVLAFMTFVPVISL